MYWIEYYAAIKNANVILYLLEYICVYLLLSKKSQSIYFGTIYRRHHLKHTHDKWGYLNSALYFFGDNIILVSKHSFNQNKQSLNFEKNYALETFGITKKISVKKENYR